MTAKWHLARAPVVAEVPAVLPVPWVLAVLARLALSLVLFYRTRY